MTKACWNCGMLVTDEKFCCKKCEVEYYKKRNGRVSEKRKTMKVRKRKRRCG